MLARLLLMGHSPQKRERLVVPARLLKVPRLLPALYFRRDRKGRIQ